MNRLLLSLVIILLPLLVSAQQKDWLWLKKLDKNDNTFITKTAADKDGNLYVTGTFNDTALFDNTTLIASDGDVFLAKYDAYGTLLWVQKSGYGRRDEAGGVVTDANGNVYILGYYHGVISPDSIFGTPAKEFMGNGGMYLAKLDGTGIVKWVSLAGSTYDIRFVANNLAIDANNNLYVAGGAGDSLDLGTVQKKVNNAVGIFLAKYDNNGVALWATGVVDSTAIFFSRGITVDNNNEVYVATSWNESNFSKYDASGTRLWRKTFKTTGGIGQFRPNNICANADGIYMSAGLNGNITLGNTFYTFTSNRAMIVSFDYNGDVKWSGDTKAQMNSTLTNVGIDKLGNVYTNAEGLIYARYDKNGIQKWAENGNSQIAPGTFAENNDGSLYISFDNNHPIPQTVGSYTIDKGAYIGKLAAFPTSISTTKYEKATLYPNPAHNILYVGGTDKGEYSIMNITGTTLLSGTINNERNIDISSLAPGIYNFTLTTPVSQEAGKNNKLQSTFIKQ
jgi:hypothetical protein